MRLKSLDIKGFKSFADKTIIHFDEGVTGIIGPNGCGKSNIIDSIRWVIGEQKISNLRSENLESLVFNGSKNRSGSGMAEVSLTFENTRNLLPTEFSTVTVTRRFYKNGESEYRLNDVQCRLKDINNLFLDTGVSNDSYAIIELGMVDDIIKDKENSRRRMLEQAAGVTIYKTRKKETKLKLDATEQDLARIDDLLFEINNQLKQLESQAKKAEKYHEIRKEYRVVSIELAKASLEGFNTQYKTLNEQQAAETEKRSVLDTAIVAAEAEAEGSRADFLEKENNLQLVQQAFNELQQQLRKEENEKNLARQRLQHLTEKEHTLTDFLQRSEGHLKSLEEGVAYTNVQAEEQKKVVAEQQLQLEEIRKVLDEKRLVYDEKRKELDKVRNHQQTVQHQQFQAEKKSAVADASIQNLQRSIYQLHLEEEGRKTTLENLHHEKEIGEQEREEKKYLLQQLQTQHQQAKDQIAAAQSELEQLRNFLAEDGRKLDSRRNEHNLLKSLIDSMEGYPESVKFLHKNTGWNHTAPLLSDIIYVKEGYRPALENMLEPYLNYYVVNNLQEGLQAVHLLSNNKKGKANFFLLDQVQPSTVVNPGNHLPEGAIPAMDVVEVDAPYQQLARALLGNVVIAEGESVLENTNGFVVLDKAGHFVRNKYSLSGGSVGLFEGKRIGRAKNLEKLREEIAAQEEVVTDLKTRIGQKQAEVLNFNAQLQDAAIRKTEQEIGQCNNKVFSVHNRIETIEAAQKQSAQRLQQLQDQLAHQQEEIAVVKESHQELTESLKEAIANLASLDEVYKQAGNEYQQVSGRYNESNINLTRQQSKLASLVQEGQYKARQVADLQQQREASTHQLQQITIQLEESRLHLEKVETLATKLQQQKETDEKALNEKSQQYYHLRNAISQRESELRHTVKSRELSDMLLNEIREKLNNLKLQLAGMKERLDVEFKIKLDDILDEERQTETPLEELQTSVDRMKKRLENLGEVNPTAIEAYTEMKKRYEFIQEQKADLVKAKGSLLQTIREVEATANQQFLDTFNRVRDNFQKVFKALFTEEDTADMILVDPENLAESGIDIVAKPKGKRPASINQLSGGEKTLTATALLFSIYLIKPAPFCILDEVDAPLDDANIGKFTNMIRQFSENSQFIIVTHNKQTMSAVDVIYGVTMQEAGVSKLVPVDFRSLN